MMSLEKSFKEPVKPRARSELEILANCLPALPSPKVCQVKGAKPSDRFPSPLQNMPGYSISIFFPLVGEWDGKRGWETTFTTSFLYHRILYTFVVAAAQLLSCVRLFATPRTISYQAPLSMEFPRQEYWSGLHFLLQGNFLTQGSNPYLLHSCWILYHQIT